MRLIWGLAVVRLLSLGVYPPPPWKVFALWEKDMDMSCWGWCYVMCWDFVRSSCGCACCGLRDVSKRRRRRLPLSRRACLASRWQKSAPRKRACDSRWQGPFAGETTRWSPNLPTFSIMCQMMTWHSDTGTESGFEGAQHDPHLQIPPPAWY